MRKIKIPAAAVLVLSLVLALCACAAPVQTTEPQQSALPAAAQAGESCDIAFIPDTGEIENSIYNQVVYDAVKRKAEGRSMTVGLCLRQEDTAESLIKATDDAAAMGAKYIVTAGSSYGGVIETVQGKYPDIMFLVMDASIENPLALKENVTCINFREEQSGFAAGYAAVKDGNTKLAFVGGRDVTPVESYGYGFIQGAELAAKELEARDITVDFWYSGSFLESDEVAKKAAEFYQSGDQIIFSCGGSIIYSCIKAAEECSGKLIGVDTDQSSLSDCIVTSAYKNMTAATNAALSALMDNGGAWPSEYAGLQVYMDATSNCVGLPTVESSWRFDSFTLSDYETVMLKVMEGAIKVKDYTAGKPETEYLTVNYLNG